MFVLCLSLCLVSSGATQRSMKLGVRFICIFPFFAHIDTMIHYSLKISYFFRYPSSLFKGVCVRWYWIKPPTHQMEGCFTSRLPWNCAGPESSSWQDTTPKKVTWKGTILKKGKDSLPTLMFQGQTMSFRRGRTTGCLQVLFAQTVPHHLDEKKTTRHPQGRANRFKKHRKNANV